MKSKIENWKLKIAGAPLLLATGHWSLVTAFLALAILGFALMAQAEAKEGLVADCNEPNAGSGQCSSGNNFLVGIPEDRSGKIVIAGDLIINPQKDKIEDEIEVEGLTAGEWKELSEARKRLDEIEDKIRRSHGEYVRYLSATMNADCRGHETTVKIIGKQVLKTTRYARGGCF